MADFAGQHNLMSSRTDLIYEDYPGCPNPPLLRVPETIEAFSIGSFDVIDSTLSRSVMRDGLENSDLVLFLQQLKSQLGDLLRTVNLRQDSGGLTKSASLALRDDPENSKPLLRAATFLKAAWAMHDDIRAGRFPIDFHNGQPLEMRQYLNLFGTSVSYSSGTFRLFKSPVISQVAVLAKGKVHLVDFGQSYKDHSLSDIEAELQRIWTSGQVIDHNYCDIGVITSLDSANQKIIFDTLLTHPTNRESIDAMRNVFLTVCLDLDVHPGSYPRALHLAHCGNVVNRWFHSSLQIVIFGNARSCLICNFNAYLDGNTMMRAAVELQSRASKYSARSIERTALPSTARSINWEIPRKVVSSALMEVNKLLDEEQSTFDLPECGKLICNGLGIKPVPLFVCSLQLAASRLFGRPVRIGEMLTRSRFRYMGVITAAITTPAMVNLISTWPSLKSSKTRRKRLVELAAESYLAVCRETRSTLTNQEVIALFRSSTSKAQCEAFDRWRRPALLRLQQAGLLVKRDPEIIISHPQTFSEVPSVGRPGVKVPYVDCFALHYQILEQETYLTITRSTKCKLSTSEIVCELGRSIREVLDTFTP